VTHATLSQTEFAAWFRLLETPGVGRDTARRLLAACGSPASVFSTPTATLRQLGGAAVAQALGQEPPQFAQRSQAALAWWQAADDRHVLTLDHPAWPALLLQTADPPLLLYAQGDLRKLSQSSLAVVGSRHPTPQGADNARHFAAALGAQGYAIVSGLAQGIDAAAHEGALSTAGGTIAVVGTGLDRVYPPRNQDLAQRIAQQGLLLSEFSPGTPPLPEHFPLRNRIIAGLTQGTLVVEAALRSGSLITARLANEAGREVFALPGSIHAPQSQGCHQLIRQGALLVASAQDILDELQSVKSLRPKQSALPLAERSTSTEASQTSESADPVLDALGHDPVTLDALLARTGWSTAALTARLLELELQDRASRLPGGLFQRRELG
jgi:DNA processing protein